MADQSTEMMPWQRELIDRVANSRPGEFKITMSGRNVGKSQMAAHAIKRLMDDMLNRPVEDLMLSEGKIYGARYYCVEPVGGNWSAMEIWCTDTFGDAADVWDAGKLEWPDCGRWYMNDRRFWFRSLKDRDWFILKWQS
jgi:hypothetical protein